jgi:hypothetical protein
MQVAMAAEMGGTGVHRRGLPEHSGAAPTYIAGCLGCWREVVGAAALLPGAGNADAKLGGTMDGSVIPAREGQGEDVNKVPACLGREEKKEGAG